MSDELNEIADNITQPAAWIRVLFMTVFGIASYFVLLPLILVLSIAQALFTLITGNANANLKYFSAALELYVSQLFKFMTYLTETKPYPFSDLPEVEDGSLEEEPAPEQESKKANGVDKASDASTGSTKPDVKKKAVVKKVAKKKASKKKAAKKAPKISEKSDNDMGDDDAKEHQP